MTPGRLLPGSLTHHGGVVDYRGETHFVGPCFVPFDTMKPARKGMLGNAGWCLCPARDWPSILPRRDLACVVHRDYYRGSASR